MKRTLLLASSLLVLIPALASAEGWPQFRGPGGQGEASASLPAEWSKDKNVAWTAEIPGVAWSQPVVWGDKIFVTTAITENQRKPRAGGGGGFGGGGFGGGRGGFGPPREPQGGREGEQPRREPPGDRDEADRPERNRAEGDDAPRPRPQGRPGGFGGGGFGGGRGGFGRSAPPPNVDYQWKVLCLDAKSGSIVWEKLAHEGKPAVATHSTNTYASETPVTDGERLYVYFGMLGLYCYDLSGELVWRKKVESHPMMMGWGTGSSPVLYGDRLYLQCDNEEKSYLAAFDKKTGDELWRIDRNEKSTWSTPYIWENAKRTELVASGGRSIRSYDPASGKLLWELSGGMGQSSATPVGDRDMLYVGTGGGMGSGPLTAVRAGAEGDITLKRGETSSDAVAWSVQRAGPQMSSPLLHAGNLYVLGQRGGIAACYDAKTGKEHYRQRIPEARGFTASPWVSGGRIFCLDEDGQTFVLEPGPELKVVGKNKLDDMFWSSVAVAGERLLLRGVDKLYCISR